MSRERIRWAELLDVLTDSDRKREVVLERATETERLALFLLRREKWSAQVSPKEVKEYDIEIAQTGARAAVQVRNQRAKVHLGQIEKFLDFLAQPNTKNFTDGLFISTSGFTPSVYAYLREEKITNLRLAIMRDNRLIFDCGKNRCRRRARKNDLHRRFYLQGRRRQNDDRAHLAGAFALNGYDVGLLDFDRQQNMRKILGEGVYLPSKTKAKSVR
jgi:chromosome partitioning protein